MVPQATQSNSEKTGIDWKSSSALLIEDKGGVVDLTITNGQY